jgi:hypothetical protein
MKIKSINTLDGITTGHFVNQLNNLVVKFRYDITGPDDSWDNLTKFIMHYDDEHVFAYSEDPYYFSPESFISEEFTKGLPVIFIRCKMENSILQSGDEDNAIENVVLGSNGTLKDVTDYPEDNDMGCYSIPSNEREVMRVLKGFMLLTPHGILPEWLENEFRTINASAESVDQVVTKLSLLKSVYTSH